VDTFRRLFPPCRRCRMRRLIPMSVALLVACETEPPTSVSRLDDLSPSFNLNCTERPDHPQCSGEGGSGGRSGPDSELALAGGFVAAAAPADIGNDNKKFLKIGSSGLSEASGLEVQINFGGTVRETCTGDVSDDLFDALTAPSLPADVAIQVIKESVTQGVRDPAHWITVRRSEDDIEHPFVTLNHSTGDHPDALVEVITGDINDASQPRELRFSGGAVRVVQRIDTNTSLHMICDQAAGDPVTVTIAPAP